MQFLQHAPVNGAIKVAQPDIYPVNGNLNTKQQIKDFPLLIIFGIFTAITLATIAALAIAFGNYNSIGVLINGNGQFPIPCSKFIDQSFSLCINNCTNGTLYIQKYCITNINQSSLASNALNQQIVIYNLNLCFNGILAATGGLLIFTVFLYLFLILLPKILYFYVALTFFLLLGFAFYLLKNQQIRQSKYSQYIYHGSILYEDEHKVVYFSYILFTVYLITFPFIIFSPKKIVAATVILEMLKEYFKAMWPNLIISLVLLIVTWICCMLEIFLFLYIFTAGTPTTSKQSFFYIYQGFYLAHPAILALHLFRIYWFYGTLITWHQHFVDASLCIWYFGQNQQIKPIKRTFKKSRKKVGSSAMSALLTPLEWIILLFYAVFKPTVSKKQADRQRYDNRKPYHLIILQRIQNFITFLYSKINRNGPSCGLITNKTYFQICEKSSKVFCSESHILFNIGGTISIFLVLFWCMLWVLSGTVVLNTSIYNTSFPPPITSLSIPLFAIFFSGVITNSVIGAVLTTAIDSVIFRFLVERRFIEKSTMKNKDEQYGRRNAQQILEKLLMSSVVLEDLTEEVIYSDVRKMQVDKPEKGQKSNIILDLKPQTASH